MAFFQAHRDAVLAEWQSFLNLCIAQETHLDNIEDYRKVNHNNHFNNILDPESPNC